MRGFLEFRSIVSGEGPRLLADSSSSIWPLGVYLCGQASTLIELDLVYLPFVFVLWRFASWFSRVGRSCSVVLFVPVSLEAFPFELVQGFVDLKVAQ